MKIRREKLEAIFEAAAALETDIQRREYLERACPDMEIRSEVQSLLEAMKNPDSLFDEDRTVSEETLQSTPVLEQAGTQIDRYKLLQKLGEGGFGVVYMADQKEPVKRRIALKIIKLGMDTKQVVARFEAERQALAMMDHPNIAKVLDAGSTETGRPYFVMELVKGVAITKYCDDNNLTTKERLDLFIPVCQAIQHAHQKGIIHRDIKPSNVMVTLHDGVPVPKVIDFGIAKATQQELTEKTIFTQYSQFIGTPAYMSPEQAEMSGLDIDTRSDIYSLGVLLYELLVGKTPLDGKELMSGGYDEIRRRIKEEEPSKPSTRVNTMEGSEKTTVARHRKIGPDQLSSELRGDLDWIVLKSLEKDRTRRYETANGFVLDIKRFLENEPVTAVPPSKGYVMKKYVRRHKTSLVIAATIVGLLIAGVATSSWQAIRATRAQRMAEAAESAEFEQRVLAQDKQEEAEKAQSEAEQAKTAAEQARKKAERSQNNFHIQAYQSDMNLASQAYEAGQINRMNELIEQYLPDPWEKDLRGFEWYYLWKAGHLNTGSFTVGAQHALKISPDGNATAISGWPNWISVGGRQSERYPIIIRDPETIVYDFTPDGAHLVIGEQLDRQIRVHDMATRSERRYPFPEGHSTHGLTFSPSGDTMATSGPGENGEIVFWTTDSWKPTGQTLQTDGEIRALVFGHDGKSLIAGMEDSRVVVWDITDRDNPTVRKTLTGHSKSVTCIERSPDAEFFVTGSSDETLRVWKNNLELIETRDAHGPITALQFSLDGQRFFAGTTDDNRMLIWDVTSEPPSLDLAHEIRGHSMKITGGAFSENNTKLLSTSKDGSVKTWDLSQCEPFRMPNVVEKIRSITYSKDGQSMWLIGLNGAVYRWHLNGEEDPTPMRLPEGFRTLAISEGGDIHAGTDEEGYAAVWDTRSDQVKKGSWKIADEELQNSDFSEDGSTLVWMNKEAVYVWNHQKGFQIKPHVGTNNLPQYAQHLHLPSLSPDGALLLTTGTEKRMGSDLWDISSSNPARAWPSQSQGIGPDADATFSPDGTQVAISDWGRSIRLVDVASGETKHLMKGHTKAVNRMVYSRDGSRLASIGGDNKLCIWDVKTGRVLGKFPCRQGFDLELEWSPMNDSIAVVKIGGIVQVFTATSRNEVDDNVDHIRNRLNHFAQQREWKKASIYFQKIMDRLPQTPTDFEESQEWMRMAALLVAAGEREKYDRLCNDMIDRFDHMLDPVLAERITKTCLILPPTNGMQQKALELAMLATSKPKHWVMPYAKPASALAEYRAGNYDAALKLLDPNLPEPANWVIRGYTHLVRAMSETQKGNTVAAEESLKEIDAVLEEHSETNSKDVLSGNWHDWLFLQALRKEAGMLIEGDSSVASK